jgi:hypothetical protein
MLATNESARHLRARASHYCLTRQVAAHPRKLVDQGDRFLAEDRAQIDLDIAQASLAKAHPCFSSLRAFFSIGHLAISMLENTLSAAGRQTPAQSLRQSATRRPGLADEAVAS